MPRRKGCKQKKGIQRKGRGIPSAKGGKRGREEGKSKHSCIARGGEEREKKREIKRAGK